MSNASQHWDGYIARRDGTGETTIEVSASEVRRAAPIDFWAETAPLGRIMVAAREGKVCWVGIHDSAEFLERELRADFSAETIGVKQPELAQAARSIAEEVAHPARYFELPVAFDATPFQLGVWRELLTIPRGTTRSYGAIAQRLGRFEAARAVGRANGSNPLAVIIPCHRAIGADGGLTGYRWGIEYKERLLAHERARAADGVSRAAASRLSTARAAFP